MIYKYKLHEKHTFQIKMPLEMEPLHIGLQDGEIFLWANVNLDSPTVKRTFHCVNTGTQPPEAKLYLGTVVLKIGYVWHFFSDQSPIPAR